MTEYRLEWIKGRFSDPSAILGIFFSRSKKDLLRFADRYFPTFTILRTLVFCACINFERVLPLKIWRSRK